jgi:tRNA(fMet)-specific endonuclease VapC
MERSLLDTDIFSELLRGRNKAVIANADAYLATFGRFTISVITVAEMVEGLKWKSRQQAIDKTPCKAPGRTA